VVVGSGSVVVGGSVVVVVLAGTMEVTIEVTVIMRGSCSAPAAPAAAPATNPTTPRSGRHPKRVATTAVGRVSEAVAAVVARPAGRRPLLGWLPPAATGWDRLGGSVGHGLPPSASSLSGETPRCQQGRQGRLAALMCLALPKHPELPRSWGASLAREFLQRLAHASAAWSRPGAVPLRIEQPSRVMTHR
jgi:hypothetical protein